MKFLLTVLVCVIVSLEGTLCHQPTPAEMIEGILSTLSGALNLAKNLPKTIDALRKNPLTTDSDLVREMANVILSSLNATSVAIGNLAINEDVKQDSRKTDAISDIQAAVSSLAIPVVQLQHTLQDINFKGMRLELSVRLELLEKTLRENVVKVQAEVTKADRVAFR
ncbi:uncharacterized protein LOC131685616 [Topomyia yanbarensis]|uniref:uncharacterized protein LOC131685616 n=1 Tax=Topomyia yanbarensis TaxID=2498891 RepID=UPI00273CD2F2|nr:uncharacterized protein LOC131685616 [Topomyia yanbarensis]